MTSEEALLEKIKVLPPDLKREVAHFVEFLQTKVQKQTPRVSLEGIWADMDVNITEEDIAEARREMWGNFPREHFFDKEENQ
ncbi:MAG TPA: DUF2281 domain-containing protein [Pyrinomonadaceae bacterium]|nr:DUF2281 domain-containing protein [Pyrinomonadaceae bacterium]